MYFIVDKLDNMAIISMALDWKCIDPFIDCSVRYNGCQRLSAKRQAPYVEISIVKCTMRTKYYAVRN